MNQNYMVHFRLLEAVNRFIDLMDALQLADEETNKLLLIKSPPTQ